MIYNVRSVDAYVYHYTSAKIAAKFILRNRTLKIGPFSATNDPKESRNWRFGALSHQDSTLAQVAQLDITELSDRFSSTLKSTAKLACFCSDYPSLSGDHTRDILLRGFARPRMWAQYSEKHTGVCLVFDRSKLLSRIADTFATTKIFHGHVTYRNRGPFPSAGMDEFSIDLDAYLRVGHDQYAADHLARNYRSLFFEKLEDWRDEAEWRVVLLSGSPQDCYVPIHDSLVGVVHGAAISPKMTKRLISLSDEPGIEHMGLLWNNHCPWCDLGGAHWGYSDRKMLRRMHRRES